MRSLPMLKCSRERWVCAPHSLSAGTSTSPRLSVSLRKSVIFQLPEPRLAKDRRAGRPQSPRRNRDLQQRAVLLAAEDVGVAGNAAGDRSQDREFGRQCRGELDVIGDAALRNAKYPAERRPRQHAAAADEIVIGALREDNVEGDLVDPGILAADRLRNLRKLARRH